MVHFSHISVTHSHIMSIIEVRKLVIYRLMRCRVYNHGDARYLLLDLNNWA